MRSMPRRPNNRVSSSLISMAGTLSSPIVIEAESSPGPEPSSLSPLKVVNAKEEYRRVLCEISSESEAGEDSDGEQLQHHVTCRAELFTGKRSTSNDEKPVNPSTPVFDIPTSQYTVEKIITMLLDPGDESLICTERPTDIRSSATFIIDLDKLQHPDDAKRDDFGKWHHSGSHTIPFRAWFTEEGDVQFQRLPTRSTGPDVQYLRRVHYYHPSDSQCKRMLAFITDAKGDLHHLCIASYRFPSGIIPKATPHGNSKSCTPFFPTWPSTMERLKNEAQKHGPKDTVGRVSSAAGGMMSASCAGQLPRNGHQVANIRHSRKKLSDSCADDEFFIAMTECKSKDVTARFVRDVKAAPDPALVLTTDQQLDDMVRFCTNAEEFCVATVDPTFNLGDFDVTPLTYRFMLLESERSGNQPVFLGPVLIHFHKNFSTYLYFASTLVGLRHELEKLIAFGTDGEISLVDAFSHEFGFAIHLSCAIHLRRNVKQQLHDRKFPEEHRRATLDEIFGAKKGTVYMEGLIDAKSCKEFDEKLALLKHIWEGREANDSSCSQGFFEWFRDHKADVLKSSAIYSVREQAGLGSPPALFTTNASESLNAVIKSKVDYEKSGLNKFIDKMRCLVDDQQKEVERAVCCRGKYRFRTQYKFLEVDEQRWFSMTPESRRKHMVKVQQLVLNPSASSSGQPLASELETSQPSSSGVLHHALALPDTLSVKLDSFADDVKTPNVVLEGIWKKATDLACTPHKTTSAPGCSPLARMVESKTGKRPHLVIPGKCGRFSCDSDCPNFKTFGICSHVVAAADVNHMLASFLHYFKKQKKVPNMSALAKADMPKGRGRKGGEPPQKRKKGTVPETRLPFNPPGPSSKTTGSTIGDSAPHDDVHSSTTQTSCMSSILPSGFCSSSQPASSSTPVFFPSPAGFTSTMPQSHIWSSIPQANIQPPQMTFSSAPQTNFHFTSASQDGHYSSNFQDSSYSSNPHTDFHFSHTGYFCPSAPPPVHPAARLSKRPSPPPLISNVNTQCVTGGASNISVSQTGHQSVAAASEHQPFKLHFIAGNISRCAGCKGKYVKPASPPNDLCIQHEEWRQITYPNSPSPSSKFSNAYYHLDVHCIRVNWPFFEPQQLLIPPSVRVALLPQHWNALMQTFGLGRD